MDTFISDLSQDITVALPPWALNEIAGAPLWAWVALPLILGVGLAVARIISWLACMAAKRRNNPESRLVHLIAAIKGPARVAIGIGLFRVGRTAFPLPPQLANSLGYLELALGTATIIWLLLRATGFASDHLGLLLARRGKPQARAMIPLLRKVAKTTIVLLGGIFLLQNAGINVGAILAGLGIGGVALALAGQKTVENLFGGIALAVDQPARVGDFCKFGGSGGTIEDIGLRSTRIRTTDKTLVTIPNSKLSEMLIENFASRGRILLNTTINLSLQTSLDQVRSVVAGIREILKGRSEVQNGGRVRFTGINTTSLDIEIFAYVETTDFEKFLQVKEEIFFAILELTESKHARLASVVPLPDSPPDRAISGAGREFAESSA